MIYHSSDCLSDRNRLEPVGSDRKLVGDNSEWSDWNWPFQSESGRTDLTNSLLFGWYCVPEFPIGFWSESEQFRLIPLSICGAQTRPPTRWRLAIPFLHEPSWFDLARPFTLARTAIDAKNHVSEGQWPFLIPIYLIEARTDVDCVTWHQLCPSCPGSDTRCGNPKGQWPFPSTRTTPTVANIWCTCSFLGIVRSYNPHNQAFALSHLDIVMYIYTIFASFKPMSKSMYYEILCWLYQFNLVANDH